MTSATKVPETISKTGVATTRHSDAPLPRQERRDWAADWNAVTRGIALASRATSFSLTARSILRFVERAGPVPMGDLKLARQRCKEAIRHLQKLMAELERRGEAGPEKWWRRG
jgi:hypothetical protein